MRHFLIYSTSSSTLIKMLLLMYNIYLVMGTYFLALPGENRIGNQEPNICGRHPEMHGIIDRESRKYCPFGFFCMNAGPIFSPVRNFGTGMSDLIKSLVS